MKKIIILLFALFYITYIEPAYSQDGQRREFDGEIGVDAKFPGGRKGLNEYLRKNIQYIDNGVEGSVTVKFRVNTKGKIDTVKIVESVHPNQDNEAKRVISQMPKWKPGAINGEPVSIWYSIPIHFSINPYQAKGKRQGSLHLVEGLTTFSGVAGWWQITTETKTKKDGIWVTTGNSFKYMSPDGLFFVMKASSTNVPAKILVQGTYEMIGKDGIHEKISGDTSNNPLGLKGENKLTFEIINNCLLVARYKIPDSNTYIQEIWVRVLQPRTDRLID